jgi:hypothetical protein
VTDRETLRTSLPPYEDEAPEERDYPTQQQLLSRLWGAEYDGDPEDFGEDR